MQDGGNAPVRLEAGDILVIPHGDGYGLSSAPDQSSSSARRKFSTGSGRWPQETCRALSPKAERVRRRCMSSAVFSAATRFRSIRYSTALPRLLRIRPSGIDPRPWSADRLDRRRIAPPPRRPPLGAAAHRRVVVRGSRAHAPGHDGIRKAAAGSPVCAMLTVGRALALMHREPQRKWTLDDLAHDAGTSRSVLAERFSPSSARHRCVTSRNGGCSEPPCCSWRADAKVAAVAQAVGYESEAAFSRAFKKETGAAPVNVEARPGKLTTAGRPAIRPRITRTTRAFATARL